LDTNYIMCIFVYMKLVKVEINREGNKLWNGLWDYTEDEVFGIVDSDSGWDIFMDTQDALWDTVQMKTSFNITAVMRAELEDLYTNVS